MSMLLDRKDEVEKTICLRTKDSEEQSLDIGLAIHCADLVCFDWLRKEILWLGMMNV